MDKNELSVSRSAAEAAIERHEALVKAIQDGTAERDWTLLRDASTRCTKLQRECV